VHRTALHGSHGTALHRTVLHGTARHGKAPVSSGEPSGTERYDCAWPMLKRVQQTEHDRSILSY
jgi:hypothetical protein